MADSSNLNSAQIASAPMQPAAMGPQGVANYVDTLSRAFSGRSHGESQQCVSLVKMTSNVGHTSNWAPGAPVDQRMAPGTPIATFGGDGIYKNRPGESHAAIYLGQGSTPGSIRVLDQWLHHPAGVREIQPGDKAESAQNFRAIATRDGTQPGLAQVPGMKFTQADWAAMGGGNYGDGQTTNVAGGAPVADAQSGSRYESGAVGDPGNTIIQPDAPAGGGGGYAGGGADSQLVGGGGYAQAPIGDDVFAQDTSGMSDIQQRVAANKSAGSVNRIGDVSSVANVFENADYSGIGAAGRQAQQQNRTIG